MFTLAKMALANVVFANMQIARVDLGTKADTPTYAILASDEHAEREFIEQACCNVMEGQ